MTGSTGREQSISVLPFENLGNESDNADFADGIQEEILSRLTKIGTPKVISGTSTQRYKGAAAASRPPRVLLLVGDQLRC